MKNYYLFHNKFVTWEVAKQLRMLGFDLPCFAFYLGSGELEFYPLPRKEHQVLPINSNIRANRCTAPLI